MALVLCSVKRDGAPFMTIAPLAVALIFAELQAACTHDITLLI
jgi:hypothetical protein